LRKTKGKKEGNIKNFGFSLLGRQNFFI